MQILAVFALLVLGLDAIAVGICSVVEKTSQHASLLVFLGLFAVNFIVAWKTALWITERFLLSEDQRASNQKHVQQVNSQFATQRR
jgi:hypothetical protein